VCDLPFENRRFRHKRVSANANSSFGDLSESNLPPDSASRPTPERVSKHAVQKPPRGLTP
jgi:hypothetical protein